MVKKIGPVQAPISLVIVFIYFMTFNDNKGKDNLLTKIYVLIISTFIIALLFTAYIFVYKQDNVSLTNGQATLWDTKTVELADEICVDCDTNEEKVKAIYGWVICNFEYNYDCKPIIQYFNVRKTLTSKKGICYDFAHLFTTLCRTQNIPCYVVDGTKIDDANYHHTWNRVYFDGSCWNVDITFDTIQTQSKGELYGFRSIENAYSPNKEFIIRKIY